MYAILFIQKEPKDSPVGVSEISGEVKLENFWIFISFSRKIEFSTPQAQNNIKQYLQLSKNQRIQTPNEQKIAETKKALQQNMDKSYNAPKRSPMNRDLDVISKVH